MLLDKDMFMLVEFGSGCDTCTDGDVSIVKDPIRGCKLPIISSQM